MASNIVEIKLSEIDKVQEVLSKQNQEIERLHSIIKEVREHIEEKIELYTVDLTEKNKNKLSYTAPIRAVYKELLEILDKENK